MEISKVWPQEGRADQNARKMSTVKTKKLKLVRKLDKKWPSGRSGSKSEKSSDGKARLLALSIAGELGKRFGAKKVILFGSLARGDWGTVFDIDLAAQGIPAGRFFRAVAFATGVSPDWKVDLVDIKDCSKGLRKVIEGEGILLWPEKGQSSHPEF